MSQLDRHVEWVQAKFTTQKFLHGLAASYLVFLIVFWIAQLVDKFTRYRPPHAKWWIWGGIGACALAAAIYALLRRPTKLEAAVAIDETLGLKEKFSTALFARKMDDPFAQAAVKDAERAAGNVSLHNRFPLEFPRRSLPTIIMGVVVAITFALPQADLFGRQAKVEARAEDMKKTAEAKKQIEKAIQVIVDAQAKGVADDETIKQAKIDLQKMMNAPIRDPEKAKRSAARALDDVNQAIKQQIASNQKLADAENDAKAFQKLQPASDEKGPVADAGRKMAKGEFAEAVSELEKAVTNFNQMAEEDKKKAAQQMQQMAQQLQQMANNPQVQQQIQQQLQQAGLNQQQAQQAAQQMQKAAQGDKQAQQQLQQMAQQAMKQMNNGQGPNQQQQQQMQQMMKQMQAQVNTQQQAQQMAQAAQQMAQAMKQQAQAQGGQQGKGQAQQPANQQMAQGAQQMQQQLQAMQAMKADAQQVAAAQAAAAQAAADAAAGLNGQGQQPGQQQQGQGNWQGGNPGQFANNNNKWNGKPGQPGGGIGAGDRTFKEAAPYTTKQEVSPSQDIEGGKILASSFIKAKSDKGTSTVGAETVAPPPEQEATDEVDQEHIKGQAKEAVKQYFSAWEKGSGAEQAPPAAGQ